MHAEEILAKLTAQRCNCCGMEAVPGTTICLKCVAEVDLRGNVQAKSA